MTILLKIQKTLQMNSIFFVNVTSKVKEQIKTSNCDILRQFCNEKVQLTHFVQYKKHGDISLKY